METGAPPPTVLNSLEEAIAADAIVGDDRPCLRCGYNLRGIGVAGACPECGAPARYSLRSTLLKHSPPDYLRRLRVGARLAALGLILLALSWCLQPVTFFAFPVLIGSAREQLPLVPTVATTLTDGTPAHRADILYGDGATLALEWASARRWTWTVHYADGSTLTVSEANGAAPEALWTPPTGPPTPQQTSTFDMALLDRRSRWHERPRIYRSWWRGSGLPGKETLWSDHIGMDAEIKSGPDGRPVVISVNYANLTLGPAPDGGPGIQTANPPTPLTVSPSPTSLASAPIIQHVAGASLLGAAAGAILSALGLVLIRGVWLLAAPDPRGTAKETGGAARRIARIVAAALAILLVIQALGLASTCLPLTSVTLIFIPYMFVLFTSLGVVALLAPLGVCVVRLVRGLGYRIPDRSLIARTPLLSGSIWVTITFGGATLACYVVAASALSTLFGALASGTGAVCALLFALSLLTFGFMLLSALLRFANSVRTIERQLRGVTPGASPEPAP